KKRSMGAATATPSKRSKRSAASSRRCIIAVARSPAEFEASLPSESLPMTTASPINNRPFSACRPGQERAIDVARTLLAEVEHIFHVADRRLVDGNVRVPIRQRVRQIVATSAGDWLQTPVRLDELQRRHMVGISV